jgi:hypothetical protein
MVRYRAKMMYRSITLLGKGNSMIDLLFSAGQAFSVIGLAYGCYLSLSNSALTESASEASRRTTPVHHVAMA